MIVGAHVILYSRHAEALRAFLRDVLGLSSVDAGEGWPIFAGPPLEMAVHPTGDAAEHELYLMCDDVAAFVETMRDRGIQTAPVTDRGWGLLTAVTLPGGETLGVYQPNHPSPIVA
jgi:catechol 2,3-dioxygenase-like lactoylglutathione lyase family enzyme